MSELARLRAMPEFHHDDFRYKYREEQAEKKDEEQKILWSQQVSGMVNVEASQNKMLAVTDYSIYRLFTNGRGFVKANENGDAIAFCSFAEMPNCIEIRSAITHPEHRRQGHGVDIMATTILAAQHNKKKIIGLCNPVSSKLMHDKFGFRASDKTKGSEELWSECSTCSEYPNWPGCHCNYLVLDGKLVESKYGNFSIINLATADEEDWIAAAKLYCEVWKEPPWNEDAWTVDGVINDFKSMLSRPGGLLLIATKNNQIVGLTSGWSIDSDGVKERTCGKLDLGDNGYYIAELATKSSVRGYGIGKALSIELIEQAYRRNLIKYYTLRTNRKAEAAIGLYKSIGFVQSDVEDVDHPDRTYWVMK